MCYNNLVNPRQGKNMDKVTISKFEFLEFVTNGFPIELSKFEEEEFYSAFTYFVNQEENNFVAELVSDGVLIHAGMRTEICKLKYEDSKIVILTSFNENSDGFSPEFTDGECKVILASACQGIILFSKTYAIATEKIQNSDVKDLDPLDKFIDDNYKYKPWPVKGA